MKKRDHDKPRSLAAVLKEVFKGRGWDLAYSRNRIVALWPEIVDATVARHAGAEKLTGTTLHVAVDSSVWMNELAAIKNVLLEKINAHLEPGATPITDIRFHQRSMKSKKETQPATRPGSGLTEKDARMIRLMLEPVREDDLKNVLRKILEKDSLLKQRRTE